MVIYRTSRAGTCISHSSRVHPLPCAMVMAMAVGGGIPGLGGVALSSCISPSPSPSAFSLCARYRACVGLRCETLRTGRPRDGAEPGARRETMAGAHSQHGQHNYRWLPDYSRLALFSLFYKKSRYLNILLWAWVLDSTPLPPTYFLLPP